jgi:MtaA/CmuA family methyltransferase
MTSPERVAAVLEGRIPDRVPVALHNFLMACRMSRMDFDDALRSGEAMAEAQLNAWREFGHDVIMHENGVCGEAEALGCEILYRPETPPHVAEPLVKSLDQIDTLRVPDPETTFPLNEILKATRILVKETGGRAFVMGRADQGPMALAAALMGPQQFLLAVGDLELRPKIRRLCYICSQMNIAFGEAQKRAGAHGTSLGAYGPSLISPGVFGELEQPGLAEFCARMRQAGLRTFVHACGDETRFVEKLLESGADCLELDPHTKPEVCKQKVRGKAAVLGMLDPAHILQKDSAEDVRRHAIEILGIMAPGGGFLLGPGCALPADTPPANIHVVMECAQSVGRYSPDGSLVSSKERIM